MFSARLTSQEQFPFITLTTNNLCTRCHNDKHDPKLYSVGNNMDPGSLPNELGVRTVL